MIAGAHRLTLRLPAAPNARLVDLALAGGTSVEAVAQGLLLDALMVVKLPSEEAPG